MKENMYNFTTIIPPDTNQSNTSTVIGHSLSNGFVAFISTYFMLLTISGVLFNSVVIHAIITKRYLHSTNSTFIVNLAVCDLVTACSTIPLEAEFLIRGYYTHGMFICGLKETAFMFSLPSSIVSLLLLTIERYFKIIHPFKHVKIFTKPNVIVLLLAAWTYCTVVAVFPIMYDPNGTVVNQGKCHVKLTNGYIYYQLGVNFSIPLLCILTMNIVIFRNAAAHARTIHKQRSSIVKSLSYQNGGVGNKQRGSNGMPRFTANFKAAKTIMALVGLFLFCWLTYIIMVTHNVLCKICHPRFVIWIGNAINYSGVAANPVLYGMLNRRIRKVIINYYLCWRHCPSNETKKRNGYKRATSGIKNSLSAFYNSYSDSTRVTESLKLFGSSMTSCPSSPRSLRSESLLSPTSRSSYV